MKALIISLMPDALMVLGALAISYGAWTIYPPVGFLAGGCFLIAAGILASKVTGK